MNNFIPQKLYNQIIKNIPFVCIDLVVYRDVMKNGVLDHKEVLFIKRKDKPVQGCWWVVGGRMHMFEKFDDGAKRILQAETGIKEVKELASCGAASTIFDDSPANTPIHSINFVYKAKVKSRKVTLDSHSSEYKWVRLDAAKTIATNDYIKYCLSKVNNE